jgi:D-serine deaminase-like pyridoxal phosphate-dependent protein
MGRSLDDVPTPALVLDLTIAERNITSMAARIGSLGAELRPHIKAHKSAELAHMQVDAGALGVTTATVAEAVSMAEAGIPDVLLASQVVTPVSIARLLRAAPLTRMRVAVDDEQNLVSLGKAAREAGVALGVLVELDVGLGRGGSRSVQDAVELAVRVSHVDGVTFDGLMGYEGHCASEPRQHRRFREAIRSMEVLASAAEACRDAGLVVETVSAGATGTFEVTGNAPGVTEVQAGSYVLMDRFHEPLVEGFDLALTVMTTVIGRHGNLVVLDAGRKAVDVSLRPLQASDPAAVVEFIHEEHAGFRYREGTAPDVGERLRLVPGYAPTTVNLFGAYQVVRDEQVVDTWPVLARHGSP